MCDIDFTVLRMPLWFLLNLACDVIATIKAFFIVEDPEFFGKKGADACGGGRSPLKIAKFDIHVHFTS